MKDVRVFRLSSRTSETSHRHSGSCNILVAQNLKRFIADTEVEVSP